ncbi:MAG: hypothetical protein KDE47_01095, partial [Caldilineaceae bacterium]|nr:hypothetical protein [Caldilineaceae bacterium]
IFCYAVAPEQAPANGSYAVTAAKSNAADGSLYGLIFGLDRPTIDANSQYYIFYVDPADQTYALAYYNQGSSGYLTGDSTNAFVNSAAIGSGGAPNELRVRREGNRIDLFVNNLHLTTVNDGTFAGNRYVGLANWRAYPNATTALTAFDDFVVSAVDVVYQDDYADVGSGWAVGDIEICQASYGGGEYRTASQPDYFCWFIAPSDPQTDGRFRATMRRGKGTYPFAYGIIVGYEDDGPNFYALLVIPEAQSYALTKYIDGQGWFGITWNEFEDTPWLYSSAINSGTNTNDLELERDGNLLRILINGTPLGGYVDFEPLQGGYFGLINSASQFEPALADFDNYRVTTWADGGSAEQQTTNSRPEARLPQQLPRADLDAMKRLEGVAKVE